MALTVAQLRRLLSDMPAEMEVITQNGETFVNVMVGEKFALSTVMPIGTTKSGDHHVYPTHKKFYAGYCPQIDAYVKKKNINFTPKPEEQPQPAEKPQVEKNPDGKS